MYQLFSGTEEYNAGLAPTLVPGSARIFSATDPRDKIFGIFGLLKGLNSMHHEFISANHSHDKCRVYTDVTRSILMSKWLRFLSMIQPPTNVHDSRLPSWVPNPEADCSIRMLPGGNSPAFNAAGKPVSKEHTPASELKIEGPILSTLGHRVGKSEQ
jgi:hypothetical protein